jgi:hypothetical protein
MKTLVILYCILHYTSFHYLLHPTWLPHTTPQIQKKVHERKVEWAESVKTNRARREDLEVRVVWCSVV